MIKLIPNWRVAYRFASVVVSAALVVLSTIQAEALPLLQPIVPADKWPWVSGLLGLAVIFARLVDQGLSKGGKNV